MQKIFLVFIFFTTSNFLFGQDIHTEFANNIWFNMQDIPEVIYRIRTGNYSDIKVCNSLGGIMERLRANLYGVAYKLDVNFNHCKVLESSLGELKYYNSIILLNSIMNLAFLTNDNCDKKLDKEALMKDLISLYKGHISTYRILYPQDIERAINNLERLGREKILTEAEIGYIKAPVKNTSRSVSLNCAG